MSCMGHDICWLLTWVEVAKNGRVWSQKKNPPKKTAWLTSFEGSRFALNGILFLFSPSSNDNALCCGQPPHRRRRFPVVFGFIGCCTKARPMLVCWSAGDRRTGILRIQGPPPTFSLSLPPPHGSLGRSRPFWTGGHGRHGVGMTGPSLGSGAGKALLRDHGLTSGIRVRAHMHWDRYTTLGSKGSWTKQNTAHWGLLPNAIFFFSSFFFTCRPMHAAVVHARSARRPNLLC